MQKLMAGNMNKIRWCCCNAGQTAEKHMYRRWNTYLTTPCTVYAAMCRTRTNTRTHTHAWKRKEEITIRGENSFFFFSLSLSLFSPNTRDFNSLNVLQLLSVSVHVFVNIIFYFTLLHLHFGRVAILTRTVRLSTTANALQQQRQQNKFHWLCRHESQSKVCSYPSGSFFQSDIHS